MERNKTWTLCNFLPEGEKALFTKWVFKIKSLENGEQLHKARLVARGFEQEENCFDIFDVYAPVTKLNTFRVLIAVAAKFDLEITQMDVCSAFLYSEIGEEVYLKIPEGLKVKDGNKYCKLNKAIYGLKKAPKYWNETLDRVLCAEGYMKSRFDSCLYYKCKDGKRNYILV